MSLILLIVCWLGWLALGTLFTWLLEGAKAFSFFLAFIFVLAFLGIWFAYPISSTFC